MKSNMGPLKVLPVALSSEVAAVFLPNLIDMVKMIMICEGINVDKLMFVLSS
jgi:hypothetical protein